jgi:micrococcal nuclease
LKMSKNRICHQHIFLFLTVYAVIYPVHFVHAHPTEFKGKVVEITDGDTINVMCDGQALIIRLYGIDCPDIGRAFGAQAEQFTSKMAFDKLVTVKGKNIDRHGRIVGEVILPDGLNLSHELVRAGLAWWYRKYAPDDQLLKDLQAEAQAARLGLWSDNSPLPPRRRRGERERRR